MSTNENSGVIQPYLFFDGRCEEALEFYKRALGAEVLMLMRYKESPEQAGIAQGTADKVMHARFRAGQSIILASDGYCAGNPSFEGFSLSLTVASESEADRFFTALADGGEIKMPLEKTFFPRVSAWSPIVLGSSG